MLLASESLRYCVVALHPCARIELVVRWPCAPVLLVVDALCFEGKSLLFAALWKFVTLSLLRVDNRLEHIFLLCANILII